MTEQALGFGSNFWIGEIRNIKDPDRAGKVQVCVHGHHNIQDPPIEDTDLPWAHCIINNSPSLNKIGHSVNYAPGSCVIGFWLDPETKQIPIVLGSLDRAGLPDYAG